MFDYTASYRLPPGAGLHSHKETIRAWSRKEARETFKRDNPRAILIRVVPATKSIRYPSN